MERDRGKSVNYEDCFRCRFACDNLSWHPSWKYVRQEKSTTNVHAYGLHVRSVKQCGMWHIEVEWLGIVLKQFSFVICYGVLCNDQSSDFLENYVTFDDEFFDPLNFQVATTGNIANQFRRNFKYFIFKGRVRQRIMQMLCYLVVAHLSTPKTRHQEKEISSFVVMHNMKD